PARVRSGARARAVVLRARPRRRGGPDGLGSAGAWPRAEGEALPAQGHVPCDLLASRERFARARADARRELSLVQRVGRRPGAALSPLRRGQAEPAAARLRRSAALLEDPRRGAASRP